MSPKSMKVTLMFALLGGLIGLPELLAAPKQRQQNPQENVWGPDDMHSEIQRMRKRMEELFSDFNQDFSGDLSQGLTPDMDLFKDAFSGGPFLGDGMSGNSLTHEKKWSETNSERILTLKLSTAGEQKDFPIDIKIAEGKIEIKGNIEKKLQTPQGESHSKVQFQEQILIPEDVNADQARIEKKGENVVIHFPKRAGQQHDQAPVQVAPPIPTAPPVKESKRALTPGKGDITL